MKVRTTELDNLEAGDLEALLNRRTWNEPEVLNACQEIVEAVRLQGDQALIDFTSRFDGVELQPDTLRVSKQEIEQGAAHLDDRLRRSLETALTNIDRFHRTQTPPPMSLVEVDDGIFCGERTTPIEAVCLYVPRGRGAFSSVACMLGVPAVIAGVPKVVLCTPPGPNGDVDAATLFVAHCLGITEVFRVGGAQAIAAVAFGTETVPRCDKVVGPGNIYVSGARQLLAGVIDPGPMAGPSESLIIADDSADPENVAWNLLVEAEHGENSYAVLVTHARDLVQPVVEAVTRFAEQLSPQRRAYAETVLSERGGVVMTANLEESLEFANRFAAEHAALMVSDPWAILPKLKHAGEILFGGYPIMSLANYAMGINAILPTGGWARSSSGITVRDYCKTTSLGFVTAEGFATLRDVVPPLSRDEGFSAHHKAILGWRETS